MQNKRERISIYDLVPRFSLAALFSFSISAVNARAVSRDRLTLVIAVPSKSLRQWQDDLSWAATAKHPSVFPREWYVAERGRTGLLT